MNGVGSWELVFQSRSGPPTQPWLEPDVGARLRELPAEGIRFVAVVPIGFVSDHMEVLYDLDYEADAIAKEVGLTMTRTPTVGTHPRFISMLRELIVERLESKPTRAVLGNLPPLPDQCPVDCCLYTPPQRPAARPTAS
jgi:ferrochelatase